MDWTKNGLRSIFPIVGLTYKTSKGQFILVIRRKVSFCCTCAMEMTY